jgi:hypothetical protein
MLKISKLRPTLSTVIKPAIPDYRFRIAQMATERRPRRVQPARGRQREAADTGVDNMPAPYTGGCQCGSVRYVLATEPIRLVACHCKECQRQSGSAFGMSMQVKKDGLTVTGVTKQFTRIADSGNENTGVFCPECGVRIYHVPKSAEDVVSLKPGTLDDTSWLRPGSFIWMKSAQGWVPVPNGVKALEGQT